MFDIDVGINVPCNTRLNYTLNIFVCSRIIFIFTDICIPTRDVYYCCSWSISSH